MREDLIQTLEARLDEALTVDDPPPFGDNILVTRKDDAIIVAQPRGPHFAVSVREVTFEVAS